MRQDDDLKKVVLVGTGFVGMSMAYSILNTGGIDELVLIDVDQKKQLERQWILATVYHIVKVV